MLITLETYVAGNRLVSHGPSVAKTIHTCGNRVDDIQLYGLFASVVSLMAAINMPFLCDLLRECNSILRF